MSFLENFIYTEDLLGSYIQKKGFESPSYARQNLETFKSFSSKNPFKKSIFLITVSGHFE